MAFTIGSNTVINDSRELQNIASLDSTTATTIGNSVAGGQTDYWINYTQIGTTTINDSFNVTSITDGGTGDALITIATDFANANWASTGMVGFNSVTSPSIIRVGAAAGTAQLNTRYATANSNSDFGPNGAAGMGD